MRACISRDPHLSQIHLRQKNYSAVIPSGTFLSGSSVMWWPACPLRCCVLVAIADDHWSYLRTLALVICMCWLHRSARVEYVPSLLRDIRHCKTKVMHHCANINDIEERSRRPHGHTGRDADCRARASGAPLQRLVREVVYKPFLRCLYLYSIAKFCESVCTKIVNRGLSMSSWKRPGNRHRCWCT
jgi:hypothetical protein